MKLFFGILLAVVLSTSAFAQSTKNECHAWCSGMGGHGTGSPECVVSFYAPKGATKFEIQLYDGRGYPILPDKDGVIKPRGGKNVDRIGIGCHFVQQAFKFIACINIDGHDKMTIMYAHNGLLAVAVMRRRMRVSFTRL